VRRHGESCISPALSTFEGLSEACRRQEQFDSNSTLTRQAVKAVPLEEIAPAVEDGINVLPRGNVCIQLIAKEAFVPWTAEQRRSSTESGGHNSQTCNVALGEKVDQRTS
jgi:hypothetical protein